MNDTFLKACRGEKTDYTPVWMMRQAGRYLPEYQAVRSKLTFLELCKTPELAAEVTIQPVDILGVDAAILFSDILIPLEAMGLTLEFHEKIGPVFPEPVRDRQAVDRLISSPTLMSILTLSWKPFASCGANLHKRYHSSALPVHRSPLPPTWSKAGPPNSFLIPRR
jgi:uroporphyrinogen decarboxylase